MTQNSGSTAEANALNFLLQKGLTLIEKNYRCKGGEIDIIMKDRDHLVFIEVKMRQSERFGGAVAAVTVMKQMRLIHTARHFLQHHYPRNEPACRFDVITINGQSEIKWIPAAFEAS